VIRAVTANRPSFRTIELGSDFNLVLAEQSEEAEEPEENRRKSTNGSGKTLLLLICHFCLGSETARGELVVPELEGWEFTLAIEIRGREYKASRAVDDPGRVYVEGDFDEWVLQPQASDGRRSYAVSSWVEALGERIYGIDPAEEIRGGVTFRGLFDYAVRKGRGAFSDPFTSYLGQSASKKQIANAALLGIDWKVFRGVHDLLARQKLLKDASEGIGAALDAGELGELTEIGDLEAKLIAQEGAAERERFRLAQFRVHPRYREIQDRVSRLTAETHRLIAEAVSDRETLTFYRQAVIDEEEVPGERVREIYAEAEVEFPDHVSRRLDEAEEFNRRLVANRREYLQGEIDRLESAIAQADATIGELDGEREAALSSIAGKGAALEFEQIDQRHTELIEEVGALRNQIEQMRNLEEGLAEIQIRLQETKLVARQKLDESREYWGRVVELFGRYTGELYEKPGALIVDIGRNGALTLNRKIEREGSQGVQEMLVFCYDLAVAVAGAEHDFGPRLLFHDSRIFDGVDSRQKATAMRLAARESQAFGFQYLLCINDGDVPWGRLEEEKVRGFVRRVLTDIGDGGLLGIRY
jgi:uncharacterized protein YydD (DUF2326 family)